MIRWIYKFLYRKYKRLLIKKYLKEIEEGAPGFVEYRKEKIDEIRKNYNNYEHAPQYYFIKGDKKYKTNIEDLVFILKEYESYFFTNQRKLPIWMLWIIENILRVIIIVLLIIDNIWAKIHKRKVCYVDCSSSLSFNIKVRIKYSDLYKIRHNNKTESSLFY